MKTTKSDEKVIIARLTAELVNDIEFIKSGDDLYSYSYRARAAIKVGNTVKEISLEYTRDYISGEGYSEYQCRLTNNSKQQFEDIEAAGIEIDFTKLLDKYEMMVMKAIEHQKNIKIEVEILRVIDFKRRYKTCWAIEAKDLLYKDKNKYLISKRDEVIITPCSEEYFIKNESAKATFEYKGFKTDVVIYNKKFEWGGAYESKEYRRINEGKNKRSVHLMTVLLKFIEAVNDFIISQEYATKRNDKEAIERREMAQLLEGFAGYPVTIMKKRIKRYNSWGYSYFYLIEVSQSDYESGYKGFNIATTTKRKYVDGKYEEVPNSRTFSINELSGLSKKQFNGILVLLLEDVKIITAKKKSNYIDN